MEYCAPRGLPVSRFRSWDELDQAAALWWQARENAKCPRGHRQDLPDDVLSRVGFESRLCELCELEERDKAPERIAGEYRVLTVLEDAEHGEHEQDEQQGEPAEEQ